MALKVMYPGMVNSPETTLTNGISESDTIIYVLDPTRVPIPPNLMTLGTGTNAETVKVTDISGSAITVERGFQGIAKSWPAGTVIARNFTEYDYDTLKENIEDLEANKETPAGAQAKANTAEANAKAYTDAHEQKAAPHSGHETPAGAQAKAEAAAGAAKAYADQEVADLAGEGRTTETVKGNADAIDAHLAEDVTQGEIPHIGLGGSISHETDTGTVTTPHAGQVNASRNSAASGSLSQVNASENSTASGTRSQVNASSGSTASGDYQSQVNASRNSTASGDYQSQVNASDNSTASGNLSQVNASNNSTASGNLSQVNASRDCENSGHTSSIIACGAYDIDGRGAKIDGGRHNAAVIASRGVQIPDSFAIAGGMTQGLPSTANRKWQIYSNTGVIKIAGQLTPGHSFADVAEVFPNLTEQKQGYGLLQTIDGFGVRPAQEGERVIGVTTATAAIVLGDTPFSWQGRWLKDEWGAYIYETIIFDEETGEEITYPKENPEWNPELEQQSRLQRPDEWTVVGLIGQVYVRLKEDVQPMDYVKAWQNGVGQKSLEPTNLQVMKITQEYDAEKGYKIGLCLLR